MSLTGNHTIKQKNQIGLKGFLIFSILFFAMCIPAQAQVGIQTDNPDASAVLDIVSLDKGLLIPRISLSNSLENPSPVSSPAVGLLVFNTGPEQTTGFYFWTGTKWQMLKTLETSDVQGPDSSTDKAVVRFDGTSGSLVKNSGVIIDDNGDVSGVNNLTISGLTMPTDAAEGKVLMSDEVGNASWEDALPLDVKENNMLVAANINTLNFRGAVEVVSDSDDQASIIVATTTSEEQVIQVSSSSSLNINTDVPTAIPWDIELFKDNDSFIHSTTTNPSRIQAVVAGTYEINYMFSINNASNQRRTMRSRIRVNGNTYIDRSACYAFTYSQSDDKATLVSSSFLLDLNEGDYLEILVNRQAQTGVVNLVPEENLLFVRIMRTW